MGKRGRWIMILVIGAAAAGLGFGLALLLNVKSADPAVQGAIVGAIAGIGGGVLGAAITAWASRRTTTETLSEARVSREETREDARAARFADRLRELAAKTLESGEQYVFALSDVMRAKHFGMAPRATPRLDPAFGRCVREMRLLVRTPEAYEEIGQLYGMVLSMHPDLERVGLGHRGSDEAFDEWTEVQALYIQETVAFEDCIRRELGHPPIDRQAAVASMKPSVPGSSSATDHGKASLPV
jgi:hypothetical protein